VCFRIRGCIKGLAGDYDGALKDLDNALQLRKDDVLALVSRGIFKFLTGDYEGALPDLNQGIKHDPAQPTEVIKLRDTISKVG
jgi:tetratricopeptide (TPR) repeat protein